MKLQIMSVMTAMFALSIGAGCKGKLMADTAAAEKAVTEGLKAKGGDIKTLTCPKDVEMKVGGTFECKGNVADGRDLVVTVTMKDAGNITYKVTKLGDTNPNDDVAAPAAPAAPPPPAGSAGSAGSDAPHDGSAGEDPKE